MLEQDVSNIPSESNYKMLTGLFTNSNISEKKWDVAQVILIRGQFFRVVSVSSRDDQQPKVQYYLYFIHTFQKHPFLKSERIKAIQSYYCVTDFLRFNSIVCQIPYQLYL